MGKLNSYLLSKSGLYVLGAGASAGVIPFGAELAGKISTAYRDGGSFPVEVPHQDIRTYWAIGSSLKDSVDLVIGGDELHNEIVRRMPSGFVQLKLFHELAKPAFSKTVSNNYAVFRNFPSSTIINYNLDGLAEKFCTPQHCVVSPHGIIDQKWGSPQIESYIEDARDWDLRAVQTRHILIEPEPITVFRQLPPNTGEYEFIAIIGYTFGRNKFGLDDYHSLNYFCELLRLNPKPVFVIDPYPEFIVETLKERIKSENVFGFPIFWNVYAEAIMRSRQNFNRIDRNYNVLLDSGKFG